jgi:hypothetical protein
MKIVSADATIVELENKASQDEATATKEREPMASRLRESAKLRRDWVAALKSGKWKS